MKTLLLLWGLLGPFFAGSDASGPGPGFEQALLTLTGASCVEELSEDVFSRWEALAAHPVDLNAAGRSKLLASGLLTPFQVASLLDYRARTGAVLSWSELALVDGFSAETVQALREFATLGTAGFVPGQRESLKLSGSATVRGTARNDLAASWTGAGGVKLDASLGERAVVYFSARNTLSDTRLGSPTFSAAYYGRRALGQVIAGHFQARFGQGLVLWSGFRMSGYSSVGAFRRNGNGFAPTGSYSPSLLGVATDWHLGRWRLSAGYSFGSTWKDLGTVPGAGLPVLNLTYTARTATLGLTATSEAAGFEARWSLPGGWGLFGELASTWQGAFSALAGTVWVPEYGHKWALVGRWFGPASKEYSGLAVGYAGPSFESTLDAGLKGTGVSPAPPSLAAWLAGGGQPQIKSVTQWKPVFSLDSGRFRAISATAADTLSRVPVLRPQLRLVARWRPDPAPPVAVSPSPSGRNRDLRVELRAALAAEYGPWLLSGRYDAVWYRGFSWSWYAEAGRKTDAFAVYLRGGIFKVDDWDDRIYVYERDAPGSFTVPARYGRGWNASLYAVWHLPRRSLWSGAGDSPSRAGGGAISGAAFPTARRSGSGHSLWLRLETVQYPWNLIPKPGRLELRLQYRYKW